MMGVVNGIIDDAVKVFGSGGRLNPGADPSAPASKQPAPKPPESASGKSVSVIRKKKRDWRGLLSTGLELVGIAGVSFGAYQIYPPAGWITVGVALTVLGVAMGVDR